MTNPQSPEQKIGRGPFLRAGFAGAIALLTASLPEIAQAQAGPVRPYPKHDPIFDTAQVGLTTDQMVNTSGFDKKDALEGGFFRFSYKLHLGRPDLLITNGKVVILTRRVDSNISTSDGEMGDWGKGATGEYVLPAPDHYAQNEGVEPYFYRGGVDPNRWATLVRPNIGTAMVVDQYSKKEVELWRFIPTTLDEFKAKFSQGDYNPPPAAEKDTSLFTIDYRNNFGPWAFLVGDGLTSWSNPDSTPLDRTFKQLADYYSPDFDLVTAIGYNGNDLVERPDRAPLSVPRPYSSIDTASKSIDDYADIIFNTIDALLPRYKQINGAGFSLFGVAWLRYLQKYVIPADGVHKDAPIGTVITLHSPLAGINPALEDVWKQTYGLEGLGATPITQELAALGRNPDFTKATNLASARFLRDVRHINLVTLGSRQDKLVPIDSSVIEGFGKAYDGGSSISTDFGTTVGHVQLLSNPKVIAELEGPLLGISSASYQAGKGEEAKYIRSTRQTMIVQRPDFEKAQQSG